MNSFRSMKISLEDMDQEALGIVTWKETKSRELEAILLIVHYLPWNKNFLMTLHIRKKN